MRKHTTLNVDTELLDAARVVLGTEGTPDTVHSALAEVVNARKRLWLLEHDFTDLNPTTNHSSRSISKASAAGT